MTTKILQGNCLDVLRGLDENSVHCVITSPPYWGLRDYGTVGQLGLEPTPDLYLANMVTIFREVRRVLRKDGTAWVNMGDCYVTSPPGNAPNATKDASTLPNSRANLEMRRAAQARKRSFNGHDYDGTYERKGERQLGHGEDAGAIYQLKNKLAWGLKPKDLVMMPARLALALQADGWWLRQVIIWHKPNPMPESIGDRCTTAHEYIYLLTKSARYFFDAEAIREPHAESTLRMTAYEGTWRKENKRANEARSNAFSKPVSNPAGRNKRSVWTVNPAPFKDAHFATFPLKLILPMVRAGCPRGGTVLDPFGGSGTVAVAASKLQRNAVLIELNAAYVKMAEKRLRHQAGLFAPVTWKPTEELGGCCQDCGTAWVRETEAEYKVHDNWFGARQDVRHSRGKAGQSYKERVKTTTLGWKPSCTCANNLSRELDHPLAP